MLVMSLTDFAFKDSVLVWSMASGAKQQDEIAKSSRHISVIGVRVATREEGGLISGTRNI